MNNKLLLGVFLAILSYLFAALLGVFSKFTMPLFSLTTIIFFQNLICFLLHIPVVLKHKTLLKTGKIRLHWTRVISGLLTFFGLLYAIKYIPLANAVLLQNTAPLWLPFIIWVWFKKKIPSHLWYPLAIGFVGVIFILKPGKNFLDFHSLIGLSSGVTLAISLLTIRELSKTEPIARILFYYFLFASILTFPFAASEIKAVLHSSYSLFLVLSAVSLYAGQFCISRGLSYAKASSLAPFCYMGVVFSALFDWLLWHNIPGLWTLFGMLLVIGGGIASIYLEKKYEKKFLP